MKISSTTKIKNCLYTLIPEGDLFSTLNKHQWYWYLVKYQQQ